MSDILKFPTRTTSVDVKAFRFSQRIDDAVRQAICEGMDPSDVAVFLADRTGMASYAAYMASDRAQVFTSLDNFVQFVIGYLQARAFLNADERKDD